MPVETSSGTESATGPVPVIEERIRLALGLLEAGTVDELSMMFTQWSEGEIAAVLEALPQPDRRIYWDVVPEELRGDVLEWLSDQV